MLRDIIGSALVGVAQRVVGFLYLFEHLGKIVVTVVLVGVKFGGQLAVGFFDLLCCGFGMKAEYVVVI